MRAQDLLTLGHSFQRFRGWGHRSVLFRIVGRFLDGERQPKMSGLETFGRIGVELIEQTLELGSRSLRGLALMDHGDTDEDLGMVLPSLEHSLPVVFALRL